MPPKKIIIDMKTFTHRKIFFARFAREIFLARSARSVYSDDCSTDKAYAI